MTIVTPENHGPLVNVAMWIALPPMIMSTGGKIWTKWESIRKVQLDDYLLLFSMLVAVSQTVATTEQVRSGLGRNQNNLTESQMRSFYLCEFISQLLYIVTIFSAKLVPLQFYFVLADPHNQRYIIKSSILFVILWLAIAIVVVSFQCHPPSTWLAHSGGCIDKSAFWVVNSVVDVTTQLLVGLLPIFLLWKLHASRGTKLLSMLAFTPNILTIPVSILRLVYILNAGTTNYTWDSFALAIITALHGILSVLVAGLPFTKALIDSIVLLPVVIKGDAIEYSIGSSGRKESAGSQRKFMNSMTLWPGSRNGGTGNTSEVTRGDEVEMTDYKRRDGSRDRMVPLSGIRQIKTLTVSSTTLDV